MAFRHCLWQHSIDLQSDICDGKDIQNAASQLSETIDVSEFKVLIEKFNEQSSDVSSMFRYWHSKLLSYCCYICKLDDWENGNKQVFSPICLQLTNSTTHVDFQYIYIGHA